MRVTESSSMSTFIRNIQTIRNRSEILERQATTGTKLSSPGDDPANYQQTRQLKLLQNANDQYSRNITMGLAWMAQSDSAIGNMGDEVLRAKEIGLAMSTGTVNATDRAAAAEEVLQIKDHLIQLGNTQINGQYIFGGYVTDKPPFDSTAISNPASPLDGSSIGTYIGTTDGFKIQIAAESMAQINVNGGDLLRGGLPAGSTGTDIIKAMDDLITALKTDNTPGITSAVPTLESAYGQLLSARSDIGARTNRLESTQEMLEDINLNLTKTISDKQDIDIVDVISKLSLQETALQAAMTAVGKISRISLVNYL